MTPILLIITVTGDCESRAGPNWHQDNSDSVIFLGDIDDDLAFA
jgi:hypothetical protein